MGLPDPRRVAGRWIPRLEAAKGPPADLDYYIAEFKFYAQRGAWAARSAWNSGREQLRRPA
jgi:hypothetical protein